MASTTSDVSPAIPAANERMLFLDAMRAFASVMIVWHHFALYQPLSAQAEPILGRLVYWFSESARSTQVFFVIGGYVMARSMSSKQWNAKAIRQFIGQRYCRLGIPYLGAIALALVANAFGRGWLPDKVVGLPPELRQVVAHLFLSRNFWVTNTCQQVCGLSASTFNRDSCTPPHSGSATSWPGC
jgi:peptidoglycan/LPS O-acetylase OafA/YrhL